MGDQTSGDNKDFFATGRNAVDVPAQPAPPNVGQEVYTDWQPPRPGPIQQQVAGRNPGGDQGYVTIKDGPNIIYAQAGSTVIINEGQGSRVGNGQNSYMSNPGDNFAARQAQFYPTGRPGPWYPPGGGPGMYQPQQQFRNVNGNGIYDGSQAYQPNFRQHNPIGRGIGGFFGALAEGAGLALGMRFAGGPQFYGGSEFAGGPQYSGGPRFGGRYEHRPSFRAPFIPFVAGMAVASQLQPSWQTQNAGYYANQGYYNQAANYTQNGQQYDQYGNLVGQA
jgi:hypothetical protein